MRELPIIDINGQSRFAGGQLRARQEADRGLNTEFSREILVHDDCGTTGTAARKKKKREWELPLSNTQFHRWYITQNVNEGQAEFSGGAA
jgi:hypothetical protein